MAKGKHEASSKKSAKHANKEKCSNNIVFIFIFTLIIVLIAFGIYFAISLNSNINKQDDKNYIKSEIATNKSIEGLESVEILGMNIKGSEEISTIEISLKNTSDNKLESCKARLYLFDDNGTTIFSSYVILPELEPNSQTSYTVACSSGITKIIDYKMVLE